MRTLTDTWEVGLPKDEQIVGATSSLNCWLNVFAADRARISLKRTDDDRQLLTVGLTLFRRVPDDTADALSLDSGRRPSAFFVRHLAKLAGESVEAFDGRVRALLADEPGARLIETVSAKSGGTTLYLFLFRRPLTRWERTKRKFPSYL